jgi:hypothetical protein
MRIPIDRPTLSVPPKRATRGRPRRVLTLVDRQQLAWQIARTLDRQLREARHAERKQ